MFTQQGGTSAFGKALQRGAKRAKPRAAVVPASPEVVTRLGEYAALFKVPAAQVVAKYEKSPHRHTLDTAAIITRDVTKMACQITGVPGQTAQASLTFGMHYAHLGLAPKKEQVSGQPMKRMTYHVFDPAVVGSLGEPKFWQLIDKFDDICKLSNHDPTHDLNGDPKPFRNHDRHYRYGGVEFVPIVVHGEMMRQRLLAEPILMQGLQDSLAAYVDRMKSATDLPDSSFSARDVNKYLTSIVLRHMLLVLPHDHRVVTDFLGTVQSEVFKGERVTVKHERFRQFMARDFANNNKHNALPSDHPTHVNRTTDYGRGRHSMMRPFLEEFFGGFFGPKLTTPAEMDLATFVLTDVMARGHGTYAITSAAKWNNLDPQPFYKLFL